MNADEGINFYLKIAKSLATQAGAILLEEKSKGLKVIRKEKKEMVSHLDLAIQNFLIEGLNQEFSDVAVISEEQRSSEVLPEVYWSIDPIDGTHNFIAGLKSYGISLAYIENGKVLVAVVFLPEFGDLYHATLDGGSYRNDEKIYCSDLSDLEKSIVAYDNQFYLHENSLKIFHQLVDTTFTMRISGCSVLDACLVSEGSLSARIYNSTKLCDIAAGMLIVSESGGSVSNFQGGEIDLNNPIDLIMSGKKIHSKIVSICSKQSEF